MDNDSKIRLAAFRRVRELDVRFGGAIPWAAISAGFTHENAQIHFAGRARGIFRPRQMLRGVLSIKTTIPREGRERRYDDIASDNGFFEYRFMGDNPESSDNRALRETMEDKIPIIYFHGVVPTLYQAIWPAFITGWDPARLTAQVVPGETTHGELVLSSFPDTRRYIAVQAKQRLHQAVFRELVLDAYDHRCAVSGLPEPRLLHAAHILPDRDERGLPVVSNGIAMSVLHHTAYDVNLLGIDPDGKIHINNDLLEIHDGPTLRHALQGLHGHRIRLPEDLTKLPNREYLESRFEQYKSAA